MGGNRAFNAALNIDKTQKNTAEKRGSKTVNVMDHSEEQRRENDRKGFRQDGHHTRRQAREPRIQMTEGKQKTRQDKQAINDLLGHSAIERDDKGVVKAVYFANLRYDERAG